MIKNTVLAYRLTVAAKTIDGIRNDVEALVRRLEAKYGDEAVGHILMLRAGTTALEQASAELKRSATHEPDIRVDDAVAPVLLQSCQCAECLATRAVA